MHVKVANLNIYMCILMLFFISQYLIFLHYKFLDVSDVHV